MSLDYGEIICKAVDEIVSTRLQGLAYDITKLCTIVDDSNSYQGKYVVSDGTTRYEAFTSDNSLKKGNSVLVTIPNGDYTMQKTIKGRVASTDTTPFKYTSPLDTMVKLDGDLLSQSQDASTELKQGLIANGGTTIIGPIYSIANNSGISGFTRLGVSANFKSLLSGLDVAKGTYGLKILIQSSTLKSPGKYENTVYDLDFSSADMIGNPYQFEDYFEQEKVFDISYIGNIKDIQIYFYQNNDFVDGNNNRIRLITLPTEPGFEGESSFYTSPNLFVGDVQLYLGYDINDFKGETLLIYTNDAMTYWYGHNNEETGLNDNKKNVELRWIHQEEDGKTFTLLTNNNFDSDKYEILWFQQELGTDKINQYAGKDWKELTRESNNPFSCSFIPDEKKQTEQIKAIGIIKDNTSVGERKNEKVYFSNLLIFENEEYVPDSKTKDAATALSIYCEDGSEGNYFIYNQNGKINNQGIGQGYRRILKALYYGAEITSDIGKLDWIRWYFPAPTHSRESTINSMLIFDGYYTDEEVKDWEYQYKGTSYYCVERYPNEEPNEDNKIKFSSDEQSYSVGNQWSYKNSNNTVICRVSIDGVEYEAIEEMRFGKSGSNGTNTTLLLEFDDNKNGLTLGETATVSLWMYNEEGARTGFTDDMAKNIQWSWYKESHPLNGVSYISLEKTEDNSTIKLTCAPLEEVPEDNFYILQATYGQMVAYLPIPIKRYEDSYIEGAREVLYNHQGIPSYYNDIYKYFKYNGNAYERDREVSWGLNSTDGPESELAAGYIPKLKKQDGTISTARSVGEEVALSAAPFYASGYHDEICVNCFKAISDSNGLLEAQVIWSQPILIMQSRYDFAMLNNWDGSLTLDDKSGTILSTMLGAGRKNDDNTFSGVLIGDIQKGTDNNEANTLTGVYGLQKGVISYSLTEDGMATLGANGNGQIIIDGSKSEIKTKGYDTPKSSGMKIDLNLGSLDIRNGDWKSLIHLSAGLDKNTIGSDGTTVDPYFLVRTTEGQDLIRVDDNNYYLQSNNYSAASGSKFDLMSGEFSVAGPGGSFKVSPQKDDSLLEIVLTGEKTDTFGGRASLMKIGNNDYYLKSKDYASAEAIGVYNSNGTLAGDLYKIDNFEVNSDGYGIYKEPDKNKDGSIKKIYSVYVMIKNNDIYNITYKNGKYYISNIINFEEVKQSYSGENASGEAIVLTADENKNRFLGRAVKQYSNIEQLYNKGFKLDLNNNLITGYNLYINGIKSDDKDKQIIIDSGAPTYPLRIGSNFAVDWDGKVYCSNPSISGSGGNINLGSFYFNSSGAGGGTWNGSSLGVSGFGGVSVPSSNGNVIVLGHKKAQGT